MPRFSHEVFELLDLWVRDRGVFVDGIEAS